ncbi:hypothetical protein JCM11251_005288 [Rhodosporidiobolus azoricus]
MSAVTLSPNASHFETSPLPSFPSPKFASLPTAALTTLVAIAVFFLARHRRAKGPLPPGPPGLPLLGNLFDVPKSRPWIKFEEWTREYGEIFTLKMGATTLMVIGRAAPAVELLDKRSAQYSSRQRLIMTSELVSRGLRMTFMPYSDLWKRQRKLLHQLTSPSASRQYEGIQEMESAQLCGDMLRKPEDFWGHCQRYAGSTIMQIAFNKRAPTPQDPAITKMRAINEAMTKTAVAGRYLVDSLPILNYIPEALAPFKQEAHRIFDETLALFQTQVDEVKEKVENGDDTHCFAKYILENQESYGLKKEEATFLAGAMYGAGSDTTADAISTFIMTMLAHPDVAARGQEELDRVIGHARLPSFSDQKDLPYCVAIVREMMRWRTVIAGGLAHAATEEGWYNGYYIPKGTILLANHWAIHLDPELYPDPHRFKPSRFIDEKMGEVGGTKYSDIGHHGYGFGRRACPGKWIAERSLFITFTRLLHCFTFAHPPPSSPGPSPTLSTISLVSTSTTDSHGTPPPMSAADKAKYAETNGVNVDAFSEGFSSHPLPFECAIEPRGEWVKEVIREAEREVGVTAE